MARKNTKGKAAGFTTFNVAYEDGTMTSNRRVANELLDQSFGDDLQDLARTAIENLRSGSSTAYKHPLILRPYLGVE
jgi:hypothetical protein